MKRSILQAMKDIVEKLDTYRLEHRISQEDLSVKLGVAFSTVNRWLNKRSKPSKIQRYHINKLLQGSKQETLSWTTKTGSKISMG